MDNTTIAAVATPPGKGGIAIIRISGPQAEELLRAVFTPQSTSQVFQSHLMMYGRAGFEGRVIDGSVKHRLEKIRAMLTK